MHSSQLVREPVNAGRWPLMIARLILLLALLPLHGCLHRAIATGAEPSCHMVSDQKLWTGPEGNQAYVIIGKFNSLDAMAAVLRLDREIGSVGNRTLFLADILLKADFDANGHVAIWVVSGPRPIVDRHLEELEESFQDRSMLYDLSVEEYCVYRNPPH